MKAGDSLVAATLSTVLNHDAVFLLRLHAHPAFDNIVAHWFFNVNVFTCLCTPDGQQRMPVIGCGNGNRVNCRIVEGFANVVDWFRRQLSISAFLQAFHRVGQNLCVWVGDVRKLNILAPFPTADVALAPTIQAGDGDAYPIVGARDLSGRTSFGKDQGTSGSGGCLEKSPT